jgi:hypothetical protein
MSNFKKDKIKIGKISISLDGTHHIYNGKPLYKKTFKSVMSFHLPGVSAVLDDSGAYHINLKGNPVYKKRFLKSFGYYDGIAAVSDTSGWYHINIEGKPIYKERFNWVGNFQEGKCSVQNKSHNYFHIKRNGNPLYDKKKGEFKWEANFIPEYRWFNGRAEYYFIGDKIDPETDVVALNQPVGSEKDPDAKIYPFKKMRGKQMYDTQTKMMLIPKLFGENGFWKSFDWDTAFVEGMNSVDLKYSGSYDFIETEFYIPVNHTVVPKSKSLKCMDCHHKTRGRLNWKDLGYADDPMRLKMK